MKITTTSAPHPYANTTRKTKLRTKNEVFAENEAILKRLTLDGVEMSNKKDFDFRVALPSREDCVRVREKFQANFATLNKGAMFVYIKEPDGMQLSFSIKMLPQAEIITEIETELALAAHDFEGVEVTWEFQE
ncbi:ribonuclease E inhibitor RraB [Sagittula sp. NFXS13]|uniref:ribonuclease E inhibitor RraB n=1 Tax=Sagittula sp. NFXS13 TaxID=2819095 RepID=UPI0032DF6A41